MFSFSLLRSGPSRGVFECVCRVRCIWAPSVLVSREPSEVMKWIGCSLHDPIPLVLDDIYRLSRLNR